VWVCVCVCVYVSKKNKLFKSFLRRKLKITIAFWKIPFVKVRKMKVID